MKRNNPEKTRPGQDRQRQEPSSAAGWIDPAPRRSGAFVAILLGIALLTALSYSNSFSVPFQFDDKWNLVDNPQIKHFSNMLDLSGSRYVGFFTFALNYYYGQLHPFGYHLVNLLIHLANGGLVALLVLLLCRVADRPPLTPDATAASPSVSPSLSPSAQWIALATAALFLVHPVQTEAVTYIVQRFASLAALFYLLTVICYLRWRISPANRRRWIWYGAALCTTVLAMKTKETTFTLPFMLLLVESVFFGLPSRRGWLGLLPFFLTLPIIPLSRPGALGEGEAGFASDITSISRPEYLFTQFRVIVTYLRLLVLPIQQTLDYDYPIYHSLFQLPVLVSFLGLLGLGGSALWLLLRKPASSPAVRLAAFGVLWFFLTLSIESSIIPIRDVIFEHRLYLPTVGLFLAASALLFGAPGRRRLWVALAVGLVVACFAAATYQRNFVWKDEVTLWSDVVKKSPRRARAHLGLGVAYEDQKRLDEAVEEYRTAYTLKPDFAEAHNNLGNIYKDQGRLDEAVREYQTAITIDPEHAKAYYNIGLIYYKQGRFVEASRAFEVAIQHDPAYADAYNNLGLVEKALGHPDEAVKHYRTAIALNPEHVEAHNNLGVIYKQMGKYNQAIVEFQTASSLKPDVAEIHNNLGNGYQQAGRLDDALREYQHAIALNPEYPAPYYNQGLVYYSQGKRQEAVAAFQEAVRLQPGYAAAHNNLGDLYKELGRPEDAIHEFQTAITLKPDLVEAYSNLGEIYQQTGRIPLAIHAYERVLAIRPDDEQARQALQALHRDHR
jgi:tetratricopeptide (TPR) repeat protein